MYKITQDTFGGNWIWTVTILDDEGMPVSESSTVHSPFGNCQTFSIRNVFNILKQKEAEEILRILIKRHSKTQLIVDVKKEYAKNFLDLFLPEDLIFKQDYTNSTGSKMVMILVKTNRFRNAN